MVVNFKQIKVKINEYNAENKCEHSNGIGRCKVNFKISIEIDIDCRLKCKRKCIEERRFPFSSLRRRGKRGRGNSKIVNDFNKMSVIQYYHVKQFYWENNAHCKLIKEKIKKQIWQHWKRQHTMSLLPIIIIINWHSFE